MAYPELVWRGVSERRKCKWPVRVGASNGDTTLIKKIMVGEGGFPGNQKTPLNTPLKGGTKFWYWGMSKICRQTAKLCKKMSRCVMRKTCSTERTKPFWITYILVCYLPIYCRISTFNTFLHHYLFVNARAWCYGTTFIRRQKWHWIGL